jgi:DNA polymerase I-like protein with 3'-5' exonuclease and polymerase domains
MRTDWQAPNELPDLRHVGTVALDTETNDEGLRLDRGAAWPWGGGYITGISLAWRADGDIRAIYVPLRHPDSQNFDREQVIRWLQDLIASDVRIVTHNALYDWGWLRADFGIAMPPSDRLDDTSALATIVDENRQSYSLEALCKWRGLPGKDETLLEQACVLLGLVTGKRKKKINAKAHIWQMPAQYVGPYAETDAIRTLQLFESLVPVLDQEGTRDAYRLEIDLLPMVLEMRQRGIRVDVPAAERARETLLQKCNAVLTQIGEQLGTAVGMKEIRGRKWLVATFDRLKIKYPLTEKGNPSFETGNNKWMRQSTHWLPPLIAEATRLHRYAENFLKTQIIDHVVNGRVHAEINPHRSTASNDNKSRGARSFRFSYSHPPLQQMPKHDVQLAPLVRVAFLPEEGETWADCDVSQQEFRLIVHYAQRLKLPRAAEAVERYRNDPSTDFHALVATWTDIDRQSAKNSNFARVYGAGLRKFAQMIRKTEAEAREIWDKYERELPFVSQLSKRCEHLAHQHGYTPLYGGARRHWNRWAPGGRWKKGAGPCELDEARRRTRDPAHPWYGRQLYRAECRLALNALIQGSAAYHTKLWMRACWREGIVPLLQMHDSLSLSVSTPEQATRVAQLGCEAVSLFVPMLVDVKYGPTWGSAKHDWDNRDVRAVLPSTDVIEEELIAGEDADEDELPTPSPTPEDNEPLPWEDETPHAAASPPDPPHTCIHCHRDPPDGNERESAYDGAWLHPQCEEPFIRERMAEQGLQWQSASFAQTTPPPPSPQTESPPPSSPPLSRSPPSGANGRGSGNGFDHTHTGSKVAAERDAKYAEEHAGEPFSDTELRAVGYRLVSVFDYTLPDATLLYQQNRYELPPGAKITKKRPRKRFRPHHRVNGIEVTGAPARRVIYNWPAIMRAGPGSYILVPEGENKAKILIDNGLLATTVLSHDWAPECVAALTGHHLIILEDHDDQGEVLSHAAYKKLAPVAASIRIVPAVHLWKHLPGNREPEPGDDVKNWIEREHGDPKRLFDICREIPADGIIIAEPFQFRAETDIPPWQWLYGHHLLRGEVAGTNATGGTGKSTLSIAEALAMVSGRTLLNESVSAPLRVVLINLEDTPNTMEKRIAAAMRLYKLSPSDIGDRLIVLGKGEVKVKVAQQLRSGKIERNETTIRALIRLMVERHGDVLSIDSFVRTHQVNENDNSAIQEVVECFEDIAREANCAVHLWHHNRKPGGERATVEAARGASAFTDACRSSRVLDIMTAKEHKDLAGIAPDLLPPGFYFRAFSGRRSFAPPADQSDWFKRESVELANGDNVGVATVWQYPASWTGPAPDTVTQIIDEIDCAMPDGTRYSNHASAKRRAAWPIVQKYCADKTESQCRQIIASWIEQGLLYEDEYIDPHRRHSQTGLFARKPATEEPT